KVSSSLAGILDALVPIFVMAFGFLFFGIKSKRIQILGAFIGFIGAASLVLFSGAEAETSHFWYAMLVVLAGASYGINALLIKFKVPDLSSIKLTASVFSFWSLPSLIILYFTGIFESFELTPARVEAFGYLG